jgi:hypothetical protein
LLFHDRFSAFSATSAFRVGSASLAFKDDSAEVSKADAIAIGKLQTDDADA